MPAFSATNMQANQRALADAGVMPLVFNGVPTSGTSGTFVGDANKGTLLIDTANGILYINTGTSASPTWTKVGLQT